jgi:hypothetical protein
MYDCNVLGDPALKVWRNNPSVGVGSASEARNVRLTPNPCIDFCNITLHSDLKGQISVSLINAIGVEVMSRQMDNISGSTTIRLPVSGLPAGSYICRISSPTTTETAKLIISR